MDLSIKDKIKQAQDNYKNYTDFYWDVHYDKNLNNDEKIFLKNYIVSKQKDINNTINSLKQSELINKNESLNKIEPIFYLIGITGILFFLSKKL